MFIATFLTMYNKYIIPYLLFAMLIFISFINNFLNILYYVDFSIFINLIKLLVDIVVLPSTFLYKFIFI